MTRHRIWVTETLLLLLGSLLVGLFVWNWAATEVDQTWSSYELDAKIRGDQPSVGGFVQDLVKPEQKAATAQKTVPPAKPAKRAPVGATLGRLEIPRLKIAAVVREGVDDKTLSRAIGHVPQTPLPGQGGNVGVAAHRDTHFRNLKGVKIGDAIRMVTPEGVYEYEVESTQIVTPKDVHVLNPTREPAMTLVTCYPFNYVGNAPKRYIVRAKQKTAPAATKETAADGA